jgi:hypothetical protein
MSNVQAVAVRVGGMFFQERKRIAQLAASARLPAVHGFREHVDAGGLITYGVNLAGLGATAISVSVAAPGLEAGLLHRVRFNLPECDFQVVRHVARCRNRAADALLSVVTAPLPDAHVHRSSAAVRGS